MPVAAPDRLIHPETVETELQLLDQHDLLIREFVFNGYFRLHPDKEAWRDDPRISALCRDDINKHLEFLTAAICTRNVDQFVNYGLWLRDVFVARKIPVEHFTDGLTLLAQYLEEQATEFEFGTTCLRSALAAIADSGRQMSIINTVTTPDAVSDDYLHALVQGNSRNAWDALQQGARRNLSYAQSGTRIIQPAMYRVGELWQTNRITVAQEHLASSITENMLARSLMEAEFQDDNGRSALFSCVANNHHTIGLRIVADSFEISGWDVTFLGANVPDDSIVDMIRQTKPELLGLSVSLPQQLPSLKALTDTVHADFGASRPYILVGGIATNQLGGQLADIRVDRWIPHAEAATSKLEI